MRGTRLCNPALAAPASWNLDASHSQVGFAVRHLVISTVRGEFTKYQGKVVLDEADVTRSSVEAVIDVNSLDTRVADRNAHLKSPDFFDAAKYPSITFRSTRVARGDRHPARSTAGRLLSRGAGPSPDRKEHHVW